MWAEVIKIEKTGTGDICRNLYVSDVKIEGESTIFHAINRNKKSYHTNLKNEQELQQIKSLLEKADVLVHNFRPGVMEHWVCPTKPSKPSTHRSCMLKSVGMERKDPERPARTGFIITGRIRINLTQQ